MKATGIVRRIDDLGRVVIPKDVRRTLRLSENDPLEIFVEDNAVIFKRYSYLGINEDVKRAIRNVLTPKDFPRYALYDTFSLIGGRGTAGVFPSCLPENISVTAAINEKSPYFEVMVGDIRMWVSPIRTKEAILGYLVGESDALGTTHTQRALNISFVNGLTAMAGEMCADVQ